LRLCQYQHYQLLVDVSSIVALMYNRFDHFSGVDAVEGRQELGTSG
jgi:hypothetical protein